VGKLVNIARHRPALRVVTAIRRVNVDAIRQAIEEAEKDLDTLKVIKDLTPDYIFEDQSTISDRLAAKMARLQELKRDLLGDC